MRPEAIVYTSNTGHTARYAEILSSKTGLPFYTLEEAKGNLKKHAPVIYMGWLFASRVKGYKKAAKRYDVAAVCGVGLCPTGQLLREVRTASKIPAETPLFTVQGGMDYPKLRGINKFMIDVLVKNLRKKNSSDPGEKMMLTLVEQGGNFVNKKHLSAVIKWYDKTR
ncbi:MAG: hypothetical protein IIY02_02000 [Firmicutes bacterium]|nr:hypothetical protein [Bacillota bacterium]